MSQLLLSKVVEGIHKISASNRVYIEVERNSILILKKSEEKELKKSALI